MNDPVLPGKPGTNRHPVDQLGQVRATIKVLQAREAELKEQVSAMMGAGDVLGGAEYIASQKIQSRRGSLDEAKLSKALGNLDPYRKPSTDYIVMSVEPRVMESA